MTSRPRSQRTKSKPPEWIRAGVEVDCPALLLKGVRVTCDPFVVVNEWWVYLDGVHMPGLAKASRAIPVVALFRHEALATNADDHRACDKAFRRIRVAVSRYALNATGANWALIEAALLRADQRLEAVRPADGCSE